jgi:type I restriction enzyme R subunit
VDSQTCKLIVLDSVINSMTEFKQIIGRGTRLRPDVGKTHFTIMDFRNATRLFRDPQFDGEPVQDEEYDGTKPLDFTQPEPEPNEDDEGDGGRSPIKYVLDDVPVRISAERVQYMDKDGKLVTKSFAQFSQENLQKVYPTLAAFLQKWGETVHKQAVLVELLERGVMLDELQEQVGAEYDAFDLICHVAFDRPPLTRQERARKVQKQDVFTQYGEIARQVLTAMLDKYADEGIEVLEEAAEPKKMAKLLKVRPFSQYGSPKQIVDAFGGRDGFITAVRELSSYIYRVS